ncbi:hypothetical protein RIF29_20441 [Crotalaria pallida]|uniref:Uncharacterized protein n=1 Tax=Crotalaria pallida TaxID=3830 RepID=A0AAN9F1K2_CROPI
MRSEGTLATAARTHLRSLWFGLSSPPLRTSFVLPIFAAAPLLSLRRCLARRLSSPQRLLLQLEAGVNLSLLSRVMSSRLSRGT